MSNMSHVAVGVDTNELTVLEFALRQVLQVCDVQKTMIAPMDNTPVTLLARQTLSDVRGLLQDTQTRLSLALAAHA